MNVELNNDTVSVFAMGSSYGNEDRWLGTGSDGLEQFCSGSTELKPLLVDVSVHHIENGLSHVLGNLHI